MTETRFLDMRYYNDTNRVQNVMLSNNRTLPVLEPSKDYDLSLLRWDADTSHIPCYIAKLFNPSKDDVFSIPSLQQLPTVNPIGSSPMITNMQVMIEYEGQYCVGNVKWEPTNLSMQPPATLSRASCVASDYFHAYSSLHICQLIANTLSEVASQFSAFETIFQDVSIHLEKIDGMYTLLLPYDMLANSDAPFTISFSDEINDLFGFNTVPHNSVAELGIHNSVPDCYSLVIKKSMIGAINIGIPEHQYGAIRAGFKSSYMFPWSTIAFRSLEPSVNPLLVYNNTENSAIGENMTICDMIFDVDDVDEFYNKMTYYAPNFDRRNRIKIGYNSDLKNITISIFLQTSDGFEYPLKLRKNRSASVLLAFIPVE